MKKNDWILIIAVILYSWMFYQQSPGINFTIFSLAAIILLIWRDPSTLKDTRWYVAASGTIVSGVCVALYGTAVSVVANVVSLSLMSAFSISRKSSVLLAGLYSLYSYASAIGFMIVDLIKRRSSSGSSKGSRFWIRFGIGAGILLVLILFFILYQRSNPLFLDLTRKIKLDFISWPWVRFTFLGFVLLYGFFYHRNFPAWLRWDAGRSPMLDKERIMGRENKIFGRAFNIKWEISSGLILLVLLNLLLLVVNTLDMYYLWITDTLPAGMTYSDYVHQGTTNMIISIAFAILIILFFFRGQINFNAQNKAIKTMAFIWIIQNVIVLVSTGYRNYLYVAEYSLTYRRIGVYIWLVLTLVGVLTTLAKIYGKKGNWYLFRANGWAFYLVLVLFACQNWDSVIARFNIQTSKKIDKYYLLSLGSPAVIPDLLKLSSDKPETMFELPGYIEEGFTASEVKGYKYDVPYYRPDFKEELNRRMYEFLSEYESKSWQSWNRQDYLTAYEINSLSSQGVFTELSLKNMDLDSLRFVNAFSQLKSLDLSNNHILSFNSLKSFSRLEELNLGYNGLYTTAPLKDLSGLKKLWLNNNSITDYSGLQYMKQLEYLSIAQNYGNISLDDFSKLKNLKELDFSGTKIDDYSILKNFSQLTSLHMGAQQNVDFSTFPTLSNLREMDLSNNYLGNDKSGLLKIFGEFGEIRSLNLENNQIVTLYILTNYYQKFENTSDVFSRPDAVTPLFYKLENLDISGNKITDAEALSYFPHLKTLDLSRNSLSNLNGVNHLKELEKLDISATQVMLLDSLAGLKNLKELDISTTPITIIDALAYCENLEVLEATSCQISSYAPLQKCKKLRVLHISNNYFSDLSFVKQIPSLEILSLCGNTGIVDFSPLYGLKNLKVLYLDSYIDSKIKRELEEKLPGVSIRYGYYQSWDSRY